ncbi:RNA-directed DNA polymerase, eukaryota [Artemisia annua]|uniref:RNA-directed DNA polymerase, eukaryota n=1 Tax=Artemisia annua TaxID=35608 RepID=A0A2U1LX53_ARTAN|nr:RNA-directed DNA polymerase, eukaryota [Artemisia annua]
MANIIGCREAKFPFKYLGVPVACNMTKCSNWNAIIQMFSSKLSLWKARLLSVGGRLTLIKSVASTGGGVLNRPVPGLACYVGDVCSYDKGSFLAW